MEWSIHGKLHLQQLGQVPHGGALHGGDFGWSTDVDLEEKVYKEEDEEKPLELLRVQEGGCATCSSCTT